MHTGLRCCYSMCWLPNSMLTRFLLKQCLYITVYLINCVYVYFFHLGTNTGSDTDDGTGR